MLTETVAALISQALADWKSNTAYWDGRNFRLKSHPRQIAPWNTAAKERFGDWEGLHNAIKRGEQ